MTATRSAMWRTTARSWAMNRYDNPSRCCRSVSRLRICAWIDTSSALTGSSSTTRSGSHRERSGDADALPLSAGQLVREARHVFGAETHEIEAARGHVARRPGGASPPPAARPRWSSPSSWDRATSTGPGTRSAPAPHRGDHGGSSPSTVGFDEPERTNRAIVDLPLPDSPTSASVSPGGDGERDVVDRVHHLPARARKCFTTPSTSRSSRHSYFGADARHLSGWP